MIKSTMFVIAVPDLEISAAFYKDVLGFEIHEIGDPGWRIYRRDGCSIMAGECADAIPPADLGDHSYFAYFIVEDGEAFYQRIRKSGADVLKPLREEPWGMKEFAIRTIDGHRIMIGEEI